jgi:DNA (cytosine-5)-methyltransferase 1
MTRRPTITASYALPGELVVDNFAGGGGASTGIRAALGRPVDIAINHSPEAIAMHQANHPETQHYCENIWEVDPREACGTRPVGLAWFSPDCTHFSRAKGTQPLKKEIRGLAWVVIRWAETVGPRVILLENVEEFQTSGMASNALSARLLQSTTTASARPS